MSGQLDRTNGGRITGLAKNMYLQKNISGQIYISREICQGEIYHRGQQMINRKIQKIQKIHMVSGHLRQLQLMDQWARMAALVFTEDCFDRDKQCYCYLKLLLQNKHYSQLWQK